MATTEVKPSISTSGSTAIPGKLPVAAPAKPATKTSAKPPANKITAPKAPAKAAVELPVQNQIAPFDVRKKKNDKAKVIRDSFSFPKHDYYKITELKKICLEAGVHVKKGEVLRAGLNLLTELKLSQLLDAVGKVEKVKTGRPKDQKK